jgi:hypothetical protein
MKTLRGNILQLTSTTAGKMQLYLPNAQTRNVLLTPIKVRLVLAVQKRLLLVQKRLLLAVVERQ